MGTPGRTTAIILAAIGALTFAFPVICLPTSITAVVLSTKGINWEKNRGMPSTLLQAVRVVAILAICATTVAMISAFPAAWERNFG